MPDNSASKFEFRGVDNFYVAEVTRDDATGYECATPVYWSPVQEIGKTTDSASEPHFYDNKAMFVVNSESADKIAIVMAPPELKKLALMIGKSFDETTGMMVDGERVNKYYAIMYRTKGTDGFYRYVSRMKGTFNIPEEANQTENDGTDTTNTSIEFTGVFTEHVFTKGKWDGEQWLPGSVKGITVDERYGLADLSNFFNAIQTPDSISASPSLGKLDVTVGAGSASGNTQVTVVAPVKSSANKLVYKLGASAESVAYDADLSSWTALQLDSDIAATAGQVITVAEATKADAKARKSGYATVVLPA